MSLINQMLKDLDARHSGAISPVFAAPQGIALTADTQTHRRSAVSVARWAAGGLCLASICYYGVHWWNADPPMENVYETAVVKDNSSPVRFEPPEAIAPEPVIGKGVTEAIDAVQEREPNEQDAVPVKDRQPPVEANVVDPKPVKTITPAQKADRLFSQAEQALALQQRQQGEILLRQALFEHPPHLNTRTRLAALLVENGNDAAAERLLLQGMASTGNLLELAKPYAQLLAARGALDEALDTLDRVASRGTSDATWHALRAAILYRQDRYRESISAYRVALQDRPAEALWWTGLAIALEHDLQPAKALTAYRRAARLQLTSAVRDYVNQRIQILQTTEGP